MTGAAHWATQYIGRPWVAGAQGPDTFDCWAFFRFIQREHFGVEVPIVEVEDYDDGAALAMLFRTHGERGRWQRVSTASEGIGVIIHRPLHAGIWLAAGE